jgi:hypothetical protein
MLYYHQHIGLQGYQIDGMMDAAQIYAQEVRA